MSDLRKVKRTRQSINQAQAKQQKGRRHAAEEKVFQRRFGGLDVPLVERRHDIKAHAEQFQGQEDHEDVLRRNQEHHTHRGQQQQQIILTDVVSERRFQGEKGREDGEQEDELLQQRRQRVEHQ